MTAPAALRFLGAVGTVTGSKFLLELGGARVLLDCGLFQGRKELRLRNWATVPFDPAKLDAIVLSHAHIDHSGYLPRVVREGFRGPVYCTAGTADLLGILLPDSARLQEDDAERANRVGYTKHHPALPLYSVADATAAMSHLQPRPYGCEFAVANGVRAIFRRAGHILGSATVELELDTRPATRLVYSGDLGRPGRPILRDPEPVESADYLLVESTYGDRVHSHDEVERLAALVNETAARGGALLVPSFAVGRSQELAFTLRRLEDEGRIPPLPVFVDSPMAIAGTEIYRRHPEDHDLDMRQLVDEHRDPLRCRRLTLVHSAEESKRLNRLTGGFIVIAGSGMATGGRILHHLALRLPDRRTTVLLPGFQAAGTRGRALQEGATSLRIHGQDVPVKARIETIDGFSAHADRNEILDWLGHFRAPPRHTWVVHGEPSAASALAGEIGSRLGWTVSVAADGEVGSLS
ncbi:MAG TPA: MBL fold metallo-hydrolase [Myxococcota bacterium]|nr:MBL fold metallo-hydrolase [Myxococcota bacterium]